MTFISFKTNIIPKTSNSGFLDYIFLPIRGEVSITISTIISKQRFYAFLLILGASILLWRTLQLLFIEQGLEILVLWVIILTIMELIIDFSCIIGSLRWLISNDALKATLPLQLGAAAAILHAIRVLIYVLGRTGPLVNFDVKPAYRSSYSVEWFWVWFAAILSVLGVIGVIVIWRLRRRK